jgi:hypothetical protein
MLQCHIGTMSAVLAILISMWRGRRMVGLGSGGGDGWVAG